jgi:CBS domain-containing protein
MKVKDIMTKEVICAAPETKVSEVAKLLFDNALSGIPVVENGQVVGIITEADLMIKESIIHLPTYIKLLDEFIIKQRIGENKEVKRILNSKAKDIMTKDVICVAPEIDIKEVAKLFVKKRINPIPVVVGKRKLVGIISRADVVKLFTQGS